MVRDSIICSYAPTQVYAVFLPEGYHRGKEYPLLVLFDPMARGVRALTNFKEAADRYGWIVACSYNSRNGSWESSENAWSAILPDLKHRYSINEQRIYTGGFSGGARAATGIASKNPEVRGVIGCGAGLPTEESWLPGDRPFPVANVVGMQDMNLLELYQLPGWFAQRNMPHNLITFEGIHTWPDSQSILLAVTWLEIQAELERKQPGAGRLVSLGEQWFELAQASAKSNSVSGMRQYLMLQSTLPEDLLPSGLETAIEALQNDAEHQAYRKALKESLEGEQLKRTIYQSSFLVSPEKYEDSLTFAGWERMIAELKKTSTRADRAGKDQALRMLNMIQAACVEVGGYALKDKNYKRLILLYRIFSIQNPDRSFGLYMMSRGYAGLKNKQKALKYLKEARSKGFRWLEGLDRDEFRFLEKNKKYQKLRAEIQAIWDSYH